MNTTLIPRETRRQELWALPIDALLEKLLDSVQRTVEAIEDVALIVEILEEKGVSRADLRKRIKLFPHLDRINRGELLPEILVKCQGQTRRVQTLSSLPLPKQREVARDEPVEVVIPLPDGKLTTRRVSLLSPEVTPAVLDRVVDKVSGRIRTPAEQEVLYRNRSRNQIRELDRTVGPLTMDYINQGAKVGTVFVSFADLSTAVRLLTQVRNKE